MPSTSKHNLIESNAEGSAEMIALNIIRTETALSKLPIHNLSKKGSLSIHIDRTDLDLHWRVSPSRDYGEPRQLAYKLDTLVINRRIDEEGRPLPQLIRLGSLRDIARQIGLSTPDPDGTTAKKGKNDTNKIKSALHQNAGAYITAKLTYRTSSGTERRLEAGFTRYTVIFIGEKLPDGSTADAVYIELHPRYREVLNDVPFRPLNYDYLKQLPPAPQRFYEVLSYRMFAAIKYKRPFAQLAYSDYCMFSAQQRYFDYNHVKKQMYKIHRPHLRSGYIRQVTFKTVADAQGNPDWLIYYIPGPRAREEYKAFRPRQETLDDRDYVAKEDSAIAARLMTADDAEAKDLVSEFYKRFHGAAQAYPGAKELAQAQTLIDKHGVERARHIVEYAHRAAADTKYRPQTFSGILHYTTPALASFEEAQRLQQAKVATAACEYCDDRGMIHFREANGHDFSAFCPHNAHMIEARITREGLTRIS